jgi:glycosyltransferase involved in cell wall biosynthesis
MVEAMILNKPVISIRVNPDYDDFFTGNPTCLRTNIEDFENNLSKILENEQFRNLLLKKQKIFLDENIVNQGSASINLIKFLDSL